MVVTIGSVLVNIAEDVLGVVANTSVLVSLSGIAGNELEVVTIASVLVCIAGDELGEATSFIVRHCWK